MKIVAAQIQPIAGDIPQNIAMHCNAVKVAAKQGADLVAFPELSLTGYEPTLASNLAIELGDARLSPLQQLCDQLSITIAAGVPLKSSQGIEIGMIWLRPTKPITSYSKQMLHADELPFFVCGVGQLIVPHGELRIAPAICYESLLTEHASHAVAAGANFYLASVAKSATGVAKAQAHYPIIAAMHRMPVMMINCTGVCDNFVAYGSSAVWNHRGELVAVASPAEPQLLCYDTDSETAEVTNLD